MFAYLPEYSCSLFWQLPLFWDDPFPEMQSWYISSVVFERGEGQDMIEGVGEMYRNLGPALYLYKILVYPQTKE